VDLTKGAAVVVLRAREEHGSNGERRGSASAARAVAKREREREGGERQQQLAGSLSLPARA
jgi:hypothetical protein